MPNIEYRGHVTLPVEPCNRYVGFGTIDGVNVCRDCHQPEPAHSAQRFAARNHLRFLTKTKCIECGRVFDLLDETDAAEWSAGHDCEV